MAERQPPWTTRRLLAWTTEYLERKEVDSPRLSAEMLLAHVLETTRIKLYMDLDRPASELERAAFRSLVERAARHEPVDYLVGKCPFYSLMLEVTPEVLIPRPSTETVVDHVIRHARVTPGLAQPSIADIGTGSGAIAVALARHLPGSRVMATDISEAALAVAKRNAAAHGVQDRIDFRQGDLLTPLAGRRYHFLVSNPPYIPDHEWDAVLPNVKDYEPESALRGGPDGMRYLGPIIDGADQWMAAPGQLVLEIAASQRDMVLERVAATGKWTGAHVLADHERLPRVLVADWAG